MPIPSGARYTDASRHSVRMPDGSVISRNAAENAFARSVGFRSNYELKRASAEANRSGLFSGKHYRHDIREARSSGTSEKEYRALAARLQSAPRDSRGRPVDRSPSGPLARLLTAMGRRAPGADYSVGDTPTIK